MKRGAKCILKKMIQILLLYLEKLSEYKDNKETQFEYGEKTAYTECLEMIQGWSKAKNTVWILISKRNIRCEV